MNSDTSPPSGPGPDSHPASTAPVLVPREDAAVLAPPWVAPVIRSTIWRTVGILLLVALLVLAVLKMRSLVGMLLISVFFGIAMDPAVTHLHQKRGWKRGAATGAIFGGLVVAVVFTIVILIPGLVSAAIQIGDQVPTWVDQANKTFGIAIDHGRPPDQVGQDLVTWVQKWARDNAPQVLGLAGNTLGLVFQFLTIGTFTFYFAASAPSIRKAVLTRLPPPRQERLGWAMDTAIQQTGGYLYSRLVLMAINSTLFFFVMVAVGVTWSISLPLSLFQGFVTEFIPAIGTYLGAAVPIIVTIGLQGLLPAVILLVWVLVYQQVENYFLNPRLSAKTMEINGGVAFGSALAGGAIAGPMGAFMAMPIAALITAFVKHYSRPYPLVYRSAYDGDTLVVERSGNPEDPLDAPPTSDHGEDRP